MNKKIVIANAFREKNKQSFFALHQIYNKIKNVDSTIDVEFHIMWDNESENTIWKSRIESEFDVIDYNKEFFIQYASNSYDLDPIDIQLKSTKFFPIYLILMGHYLRRVKLCDYYLIYDDDILINYDFKDVVDCLVNKTPVLLSEPCNMNCDKVLLQYLINIYGQTAVDVYNRRNPKMLGFNAGFQGIDLRIYDDFLSVDRFEQLLNIFNYSGIFDTNGKEIWGNDRFVIDTQQQSFFSCMNILKSKNDPYILDPLTCYVAPNFGEHPVFGIMTQDDGYDGWLICLKSKISHFIGHTHGKGKPKPFLDKVDEYLRGYGYDE